MLYYIIDDAAVCKQTTHPSREEGAWEDELPKTPNRGTESSFCCWIAGPKGKVVRLDSGQAAGVRQTEVVWPGHLA